MEDIWNDEESYQAERRQERCDEIMQNNPEGSSLFAPPMPQSLADHIAAIEQENAERKSEADRKRKERYNAGVCEWDDCGQKRMDNGTECRMHYMRDQHGELR